MRWRILIGIVALVMMIPGVTYGATGGYLNGKASDGGVTSLTNGNNADGVNMTPQQIIEWTFDQDYRVTDSYLVAPTNNYLRVEYYNSDGNLLNQPQPEVTNGWWGRARSGPTPHIDGVRKVAIVNFANIGSGNNRMVYEFDVKVEIVDTVPPSVPTGLIGEPGAEDVVLTWNAVSAEDLEGYNVYVDGVKDNTTSIGTNTYTVSGLTTETEYEFSVSAVDTNGNESAQSDAITVTTLDNTAPGAPTGLTATAGHLSAHLTWTASLADDLEGYHVYRGGNRITVEPVTATEYEAVGLTAGVEYTFTVTAVDLSGNESGQSNAVNVTPIDETPPEVPTGLTALAANQSAQISWTAATGATGYHVYRDSVRITATPIAGTSLTDNGLINGYTYSYQVTAVSAYGVESERSESIPVTPTQGFSVNLVPNGNSIIVQVSGGVGPYTVEWDDGTDTFSGTQYVISGLELDTTYTVTVTESGTGEYTETISTGTYVGYIPPSMPDPTNLFQSMLDGFGTAGTIAVGVIAAAVVLAVLIVLGFWGWRLSKKWLSRSA